MGRPSTSRLGKALQPGHQTDSGEGRLDPVRRRRPSRGTLVRLTVVAALLTLAALVSWSPPQACEPLAGTPAVLRSASPASGGRSSAAPPEAGAVPPGTVGVPVRLADPTALSLVKPGNRVDLLRLDNTDGATTPVAASALVLTVTGAADPTTGGLLLALSPAEADRAVATPGHGFAVLIRPG
jgi:hypothetical protein